MKRKTLLVLLSGILGLSSTMAVFASPRTMPDGTILDSGYYAHSNPDVAAAAGSEESASVPNALPQPEPHTDCLTTELPVFPAEVTEKNNALVPVVYSSSDGQYLVHTNVVTRTEFGTDGSRKDYSKDPVYLAARDYIIEWLANNGDNEDNRSIDIPIRFIPRDFDEALYFMYLAENLEIDLHKSDVCKDKVLYMGTIASDGKAHFDSFGYEQMIFCSIYYHSSPEKMFEENLKEEIPINPTTGLPAKVGDSWMLDDGTIYFVY